MLAFSLTWLMEILGILPRRTITDEILHNKAFNIKKKSKYDEYRHGIASMGHKFFG